MRAIWLGVATLAAIGCLASGASGAGLISQTAAGRLGLTRAWYVQAASPASGQIAYMHHDDGLLLVQTTRGTLTALDAETGRVLWSTQLGKADIQATEPAMNKDYVCVVSGGTLYVLDRRQGDVLWQKLVSGAPGAGPAVGNTHVFVPMLNGMIAGYKLDPKVGAKQTPWNFMSTGKVLNPPVATDDMLTWTTEKGYVYVANPKEIPGRNSVRFRLETRAAIKSQPAYSAPYIYACSTDGSIYAVNEETGRIDWRFGVGDPLYRAPVTIAGRVYVTTEQGGMFCLDGKTGAVHWQTRGVSQFVAATPTHIYTLSKTGDMGVLDAKSGGRVGSLPLSDVTVKVANRETDRIFLADASGGVQCLHESALKKPLVYNAAPVDAKDAKPKPTDKPKPARGADSEDADALGEDDDKNMDQPPPDDEDAAASDDAADADAGGDGDAGAGDEPDAGGATEEL